MNFEKSQNQENKESTSVDNLIEQKMSLEHGLIDTNKLIDRKLEEIEKKGVNLLYEEDEEYTALENKREEILKELKNLDKVSTPQSKEAFASIERFTTVGKEIEERVKELQEKGLSPEDDSRIKRLEKEYQKLEKEIEEKKKKIAQEQTLKEEIINQESKEDNAEAKVNDVIDSQEQASKQEAEETVTEAKQEPQTTLSDFKKPKQDNAEADTNDVIDSTEQDSPLVEIKGSTEKTPDEDTEKQNLANEAENVLGEIKAEEGIPFKEKCHALDKQMQEMKEKHEEKGHSAFSLLWNSEYVKLNDERAKIIKEHVDSLSITNEVELESFLAEMQEFSSDTHYVALGCLSSKRKAMGLGEDPLSKRLEQEIQEASKARLNNAKQTNESEKEKLPEQKQALFEKLKASFQDEEKLKKALIFGIAVGVGLIIPIASMTAFGGGLFGVGAGLSVKALGISPALSMGIGGPIGTMLSFAVTKKVADLGIKWSEKRKIDQDLLNLFKDKLEIESPFLQEGFNQLNDEQKQALNNILVKEEKEKVIEYIKENLPEFFDALKL